MKKILIGILIGVYLSAGFVVYAEDQEELYDLIPVKVESSEDDRITAKIKNITEKGETLNLDQLVLEGVAVQDSEKSSKSNKSMNIFWNRATYNDQTIDLDKPLSSKVVVKNKIESGDSFNAKGDSEEILKVWRKLLDEGEEVEKDGSTSINSNTKKNSADFVSSGDRGSGATSMPMPTGEAPDEAEIPGITPEYTPSDEIVSIFDGCDVRIVEEENIVILQARQMKGSTQIAPCADSDTRYALVRNYDDCPEHVDEKEHKIYKQYNLSYDNPYFGGEIQLKTCTPDKEQYVVQEIVETAEGCELRVDEVEGKVFVQKRKQQGEAELEECTDSEEFFELTRSYKDCPDFIDYTDRKAYKQYTLGYKNLALKGRVQVYACAVDKETYADIYDDDETCSFRHDFKNGFSLKQVRTIYKDENDSVIVIHDCHDSTEKFLHRETNEGCEDDVDFSKNAVAINTRKYIKANNKTHYISECLPQKDSARINEEVCSGEERYVHDFTAGQSFYRKNYFYYKNSKKLLLKECVQSEDVFIHREDVSNCKPKYNDSLKQIQFYTKPFIEDFGSKIFVNDCQKSGSLVAYNRTRTKWIKKSTSGNTGIYASNLKTNWWGQHCAWGYPNPARNPKHCWNSKTKATWFAGTKAINLKYSDAVPSVTIKKRSDHALLRGRYLWTCTYAMCVAPKCKITTLYRYNVYNRGDSSEYIDKNNIQERMYVCGNGRLINNKYW